MTEQAKWMPSDEEIRISVHSAYLALTHPEHGGTDWIGSHFHEAAAWAIRHILDRKVRTAVEKALAERAVTVVKLDGEGVQQVIGAALAEQEARHQRLVNALERIRALDYSRAAVNCAAFDAHEIANAELAALTTSEPQTEGGVRPDPYALRAKKESRTLTVIRKGKER